MGKKSQLLSQNLWLLFSCYWKKGVVGFEKSPTPFKKFLVTWVWKWQSFLGDVTHTRYDMWFCMGSNFHPILEEEGEAILVSFEIIMEWNKFAHNTLADTLDSVANSRSIWFGITCKDFEQIRYEDSIKRLI